MSKAGQTAAIAQIRQIAITESKSQREVMLELLARGIWPSRFARNSSSLSAAMQAELLDLRVLVVGCGGLGGHISSQLARLGIGRFRLCDPDVFEESNLNRQLFCTEKTLGKSKALATKSGLLEIAGHLEIETFELAVTEQNLPDLLADMDIAIDCLDNVHAKKMLERAAADNGTAYLHGSVEGHEGFVYLDKPGGKRLQSLYADDENCQAPLTLVSTVAATAALMCSALIASLPFEQAKASPLMHLDCIVPEINYYEV